MKTAEEYWEEILKDLRLLNDRTSGVENQLKILNGKVLANQVAISENQKNIKTLTDRELKQEGRDEAMKIVKARTLAAIGILTPIAAALATFLANWALDR